MSRVIPRTGLKGQERLIPAESAGYMGLHSYGMKREPEAVKRESDRRNRLSMGKGLIYGKYEYQCQKYRFRDVIYPYDLSDGLAGAGEGRGF